MSEKGLERETEGISVGEREPVVADSSPKGGRLRSSWKKLWKGRKRKALAPGGSVKDELTFEYCNEHGIAMVTTGIRHFKH